MSGRIAEFNDRDCDLLGISTDDIATHERWLTTLPTDGGVGEMGFPLGSDVNGDVCRAYGVYVERQNLAMRGVFIIDPNGVLQYQVIHSLSVGRSTDELLRVLDALQSGGLCPAEREVGQPTIDVRAELSPGRVLGQYEIMAELGRGAFGTVFRAKDQLLDRAVAIKVLHSTDDNQTQSLLAEARAAAALNHPNVCVVHSVDVSNGAPMIVMEHVDGQPLSIERIAAEPNHLAAVSAGQQIASGMSSAHAAGVIHGDLKPDNLLVNADGAIKIMDFGLAKRTPEPDLESSTLLMTDSGAGLSGTPRYMAPELARGETSTPASDVFAVGLLVYEMLTGEAAIHGENLLEVLRHVDEFDPSDLAGGLPEPFAALLCGALAQKPEDRISMSELEALLTAVSLSC